MNSFFSHIFGDPVFGGGFVVGAKSEDNLGLGSDFGAGNNSIIGAGTDGGEVAI